MTHDIAAFEVPQHRGTISPFKLWSGDLFEPGQVLEQLLGAQLLAVLELFGTGLH
jgi:hypothetical protein